MFRKFANFWRILFNSIKQAYNTAFKEPIKTITQEWRDIKRINFLAIFVDKLSNLALTEATFDIETDSEIANPLSELVKDIEGKRYEIVNEMLGEGDYYIFPAINEKGTLYHTYLTQHQVRILGMDGENITEAYGIIDWFVNSNNQIFYLLRHHKLDKNGTLEITYSTIDETGHPASVKHWEYLQDESVKYINANHIGFGRFKSPASSRGLSAMYGVPLNFGCEEIEARIFKDIEQTDAEFKGAASRIFTDLRNLETDPVTGKYKMTDNIFAVSSRAGQSGSNIDVYAPSIRYNEFRAKYIDDLMQYEQQVGVDRGFLTPLEQATYENELAVRRENANTISMIDKIHTSISIGVEETIKADAVFLNIPNDLYVVKMDWFDPFENTDTQWRRLLEAHQNSSAEESDLVRFNFPNLSPEEIEEKLARIGEKKQVGMENSLERMLGGV